MSFYIPNVEEAAKMIVLAYQNEDFDKLGKIKEYLGNSAVTQRISGNADEFHNASVELASIGFYDYAFSLLSIGHKRYINNTDILADLLSYGLRCRTLPELDQLYQELISISDYRLWTWRAFQFAFDYLMELYKSVIGSGDEEAVEQSIEKIISSFQTESVYFEDQSDREKSYLIEYEYYSFRRNKEKALASLKTATSVLPNKCAQCALKLANYFFDSGDYEETVKYAKIAVDIKQDQPSINKGYAYYILAMSQEIILRKAGGALTSDRVKPIYNSYNSAIINMPSKRSGLIQSIKQQVKSLEYESGVKSNIEFPDDQLIRLMQSFSPTEDPLSN